MRKFVLVLCIAFSLSAVPAQAVLSLLGIKNSMVQFLLDQISVEGELEITAETVEDADDGNTAIRGLSVSDGDGVWLTVDSLNFAWNPGRLLRGEVEFSNLEAVGVNVLRKPVVPATEEPEPEPETTEPGSLIPEIAWPRAPLAVRIDRMALSAVTIAEPVLGSAISFDAEGAASDEGDLQSARLALTRTDQIKGTISFNYARNFSDNTLALELAASEAAGGLMASLGGLPMDAPSVVNIDASGPPTDWRLVFDLSVAELIAADGRASVAYDGPLKVDAEFAARPGQNLSPEVAAVLGEEAKLFARATEGDNGTITIENGRIDSPHVDLAASGTYSRSDGAMDLALDLSAGPELADPFEGVTFEGAGFDGKIKGLPGDLSANGVVALKGLKTSFVDLAGGEFTTSYRQSGTGEALTHEISTVGKTEGLRLDRLTADLVGSAETEITATLSGDDLALETAWLDSELLQLSVSGNANIVSLDAEMLFGLSTPDLAAVGQAYGVEAGGQIEIQGEVLRAAGDTDATVDLVFNDLTHPMAEAESLELSGKVGQSGETIRFDVTSAATRLRLDQIGPDLLPEVNLVGAGTLAGNELSLKKLELSSPLLNTKASGTANIASLDADLVFSLNTPDLAPFAQAYGAEGGGQIEIEGEVLRNAEETDAIVNLVFSNLKHPMVDAERLALSGEVGQSGQRIRFDVTGAAKRLRLDQIGPDLLPEAELVGTGEVAGDALSLENLQLSSPLLNTTVTGNMNMASGAGQITYSASTAELGPVAALYGQNMAGALTAKGNAELPESGAEAPPRLAGSLGLEGFKFQGQGYGDLGLEHDVLVSANPSGKIDLTLTRGPYSPARIGTRFALDQSTLQLAELAASALGVSVNAPGDVVIDIEKPSVDGNIRIKAKDLGRLKAFTGADLQGAIGGSLDLSTSDGRQNASFDLTGTSIRSGDAMVGSVRLKGGATDVLGAPAVNLTANAKAIASGDLTLDTVDVSAKGPLSRLVIALTAAGEALDKPASASLNASVNAAGSVIKARVSTLEASLDEDRINLRQPMTITAQGSTVALKDIDLALPDDGLLRGSLTSYGGPAAADVVVSLPRLSFLKRIADIPIASGSINLQAKYDTRRGRTGGNGQFSGRDVVFEEVEIDGALNLDGNFDWKGSRAQVDATLSGPFGSPMRLSAELPVAGGGPAPALAKRGPVTASLDWEGLIDELWALVPVPGHVLTGQTTIDLGVTGDISDPKISGGLRVVDGGYQSLEFGTILTKLNITTEILPSGDLGLSVVASDGAKGTVTTKGQVGLGESGIKLETILNKAVMVRRDDATARTSGKINVDGPLTAMAVTGGITIDEAEVRLVNANPPSVVTLGDVLIKGEPEPEEKEKSSPITLDLNIDSPGRIFVRGRGLDSEWKMALAVRGNAASPRVTGSIDRVRGNLDLIGRAFDLERGSIAFDGGGQIDPLIDVMLTRQTSDLTGRIIVNGPASDPELSFRSTPALPEDEVLPRTLFGKSKESLTGSQAISMGLGLATLMDGSGGTLDNVRGAVGLDSLRLDQDEDGKASVAAGKEVADGVWVGTKTALSDGGTSAVVEVEVFEDILVDTEIESDGDATVGVRWKTDF